MNRLSRDKRITALQIFADGGSVRSVRRETGAHYNTIRDMLARLEPLAGSSEPSRVREWIAASGESPERLVQFLEAGDVRARLPMVYEVGASLGRLYNAVVWALHKGDVLYAQRLELLIRLVNYRTKLRHSRTCAVDGCDVVVGWGKNWYCAEHAYGVTGILQCRVDGCSAPRVGHGLCHRHYNQARFTVGVAGQAECSVPSCVAPAAARGLCHRHYKFWKRRREKNRQAV